ncbi:HDL215Wp [Eremothecium sinecaudum]|uniref:HDL215Wp n=1 Tax=Eremothecium sinecaudum TaxID=45286 RepID=A0A0X8HSB6_9SACH|nr:HDL215Wp [Eremothecium sinecaudum]AMD20529.1 HDL215Wp [Eremothecium sinecaudum]
MSSIVNKSGVRFTPKVRQRRPASAAPKSAPIPPVLSSSSTLVDGSTEAANDKENNQSLSSDESKTVAVEEEDPLSNTQLAADLDSSQMGTQLSPSITVPETNTQRRRSSRLDSLSCAPALFKSGFMSSQGATASQPIEQQQGRRLSTVSNNGGKKKRLSSISGTDSQFQEIKKRRMSSRSAISRKSGSAQRISVVSRMSTPEVSIASPSDANLKRESTNPLFQRTDDLYVKHTISTLKEIPRNITDEDSSRYMVDEDSFTMADLCKPLLPIGEVSDNFHRAQEATKAKLEARKKRRELRKQAREQFKPLNNLTSEDTAKVKLERKKAAEEILNAEIPEESQHQTIQLKLNADGTMDVDEESTVVDRHRNASYENAQKERLDNNPFDNLYNSSTYGRQRYTEPWTSEELIKFYKALSMWGTDFNLIAQLFPYRTRRQIKAKFINEEKKHSVIIELALRSKLPPNFDQYCNEIQKNIGTVDEFNEKLQQLKVEHEEHLKQIELEKQNAREQDLQQQAYKEKERANHGGRYPGKSRSEQLKAYRKSEIVLGTIDTLKRS